MKRIAESPDSHRINYINTEYQEAQNQHQQATHQLMATIFSRPRPVIPEWAITISTTDILNMIVNDNLSEPEKAKQCKKVISYLIFEKKINPEDNSLYLDQEEWKKWSADLKEDFFEWIKKSQKPLNITLDEIYFDIDESIAFANAVKASSSLNGLIFSDDKLEFELVSGLAEALRTKNSLKILVFKEATQFAPGSIQVLAEALQHNTSLEELKLYTSNIESDDVMALAEALSINTSLKTLIITCGKCGDRGAEALAKALVCNTSLVTLEIGDSGIKSAGASALAKALKLNTTLGSLCLWSNKIGSDATKDLADALLINKSLRKIHLVYCDIGDAGAEALANTLPNNTSLDEVLISWNGISPNIREKIIDSLKLNTSIKKFILYDQLRYSEDPDSDDENYLNYDSEFQNDIDSIKALNYRNTLWPLAIPAGDGLANMINQNNPELTTTFPAEVGNLITEFMFTMNTKKNYLNKEFHPIENNLLELAYGAKWEGKSNKS
jgi:hypothetical protein